MPKTELEKFKPDDDIIVGVFEFPPLNFEWIAQGYDFRTNQRDRSFERKKKCLVP